MIFRYRHRVKNRRKGKTEGNRVEGFSGTPAWPRVRSQYSYNWLRRVGGSVLLSVVLYLFPGTPCTS
jgi:hypothetical protein